MHYDLICFTIFARFTRSVPNVITHILFFLKNKTQIIQNQFKPMEFHQNLFNFKKSTHNFIKLYQNRCKSIEINPNHTYMHDNFQRKRKRKSNSLLHILGLLVSHVWSLISSHIIYIYIHIYIYIYIYIYNFNCFYLFYSFCSFCFLNSFTRSVPNISKTHNSSK